MNNAIPIRWACSARFSKSGAAATAIGGRGKDAPSAQEERLAAKIRIVHAHSRGNWGSPRVTEALKQQGERVGRIMSERGIAGQAKRKYRAATDSNHALAVVENLLECQFAAPAPNLAWVSDITAIATQGWWHLALIIHLCTRQVVGFAQAAHMRAELGHRGLPDGLLAP